MKPRNAEKSTTKCIPSPIGHITSDDLSPHVNRRCPGLAGFEPHPRYSYRLVDV